MEACRINSCGLKHGINKSVTMKNIKQILFLLPILFLISCMSEPEGRVTVVKFDSVEPYLNNDNDTIYIINFWVTSNEVSVGQLPDFEKIRKEYNDENVMVLLVSLDPAKDKDSKVVPLLKKLGVRSDVMLLNDPDTKSWRPKVSPLWNGELPATIIYKGNSAEFYQEAMDYNKLKSIVDERLKNKQN